MSIRLKVMPRTEYGFARTTCGCRQCSVFCEHMPGMLVPPDIPRLARHLGYDPERPGDLERFAVEHLLASPRSWVLGVSPEAAAAMSIPPDTAIVIPALVPARRSDGACKFLRADGRCGVHADAPFGCGFFDNHMPDAEADARSNAAMRDVVDAFEAGGAYARLVSILMELGRVTSPASECRKVLAAAAKKEGLHVGRTERA